jgi:NAD-dependent SIR2 family protein deacetylase
MSELYSDRIKKAGTAIKNAEKLVIGAGAGLSAAAGIEYNGKRFTENFKPFIKKYGMKDLYTSSFYPFTTQEEKWAYWAKHISLNLLERL